MVFGKNNISENNDKFVKNKIAKYKLKSYILFLILLYK